jgi:RNA 2',3'-cyclic 3'-phosphodiesterase
MTRKSAKEIREGKLTWRVFCAIALPRELRARVDQRISRLRELVPEARASWSREQNIHLTLKFLGEIPIARIQGFSSATARASEGLTPFEICIERSGAFPERGTPRVLWLGVSDDSGWLAELQGRLERECVKEGFAKEERPFNPHLTLARLRQAHGARRLAKAHKEMILEPIKVNVSEVSVIRSELSGEGAKYTVISTHPLGTRPSRQQ